jgi:hypothetical protein
MVLEEEVVARFDVLSRNIPEMFKEIKKRLIKEGRYPGQNENYLTDHITKTLKPKPKS